ncbi:MAG: hypothetical protein Q8P41_06885 [Pseudomonadota bacterium]|nr:hypothetical protein [Pseudomonadota bacterium]
MSERSGDEGGQPRIGSGEGGDAGSEGTNVRGPERRPGGDEPLVELFTDLMGKLWRRGRVEMEKAARKGRERLELRQLRSDRDRMYQKLGKEARLLLEAGELDHPGLRRGVERIRELEARLLEAEDAVRAVGGDPDREGTGEEGGGSENA